MGLLPFQLNPHYVEGKFYHEVRGRMVLHNGETRDERLQEFHEENQTPVLGLREGSALRVVGSKMELLGGQLARLFEKGKPAVDVTELDSVAAQVRAANPAYQPFAWVELDELFAQADVISLHCPLNPETAGLVYRQRLRLVKPGTCLINAARGGLVVEQDLAEALTISEQTALFLAASPIDR
jgi:hypothetical protein